MQNLPSPVVSHAVGPFLTVSEMFACSAVSKKMQSCFREPMLRSATSRARTLSTWIKRNEIKEVPNHFISFFFPTLPRDLYNAAFEPRVTELFNVLKYDGRMLTCALDDAPVFKYTTGNAIVTARCLNCLGYCQPESPLMEHHQQAVLNRHAGKVWARVWKHVAAMREEFKRPKLTDEECADLVNNQVSNWATLMHRINIANVEVFQQYDRPQAKAPRTSVFQRELDFMFAPECLHRSIARRFRRRLTGRYYYKQSIEKAHQRNNADHLVLAPTRSTCLMSRPLSIDEYTPFRKRVRLF